MEHESDKVITKYSWTQNKMVYIATCFKCGFEREIVRDLTGHLIIPPCQQCTISKRSTNAVDSENL